MIRRTITAITTAATFAILAACTTHPAACPRPAPLPAGGYSSTTTSGTMPSGTTITMSDGDRWTCTNGKVTIH